MSYYLVVAYPSISSSDFQWIESYRSENDKRYFKVVKPHFTLVFPISSHDIHQTDVTDEVMKQLAESRGGSKEKTAIEFEIRVATISQDHSKEYFHEFLVPDRGYSDIVKLHDKLYSDKFRKYLRFDIDYIPHIGIGNSPKDDVLISKKRVDQLNSDGIYITGSIIHWIL